VAHEPGYQRRAANGRLVMPALDHGVTPGPWLTGRELPSSMAPLSAEDGAARARRLLRRLRRIFRRD
jgi:hypothetical protein